MRAVIIGSGSINDYKKLLRYINDGDFVICADGGVRHAKEMGIEPDIVIGDFDSSSPAECDAEKIVYPARKDFTDSELCVKYAKEHGCDELLLMGMTGTRADHTLTNILMLSQCKTGMMVDDSNEFYYLHRHIKIEGRRGKTLSIIPVRGDLTGIATAGLYYPLNDETLYFGESRGNSNVIIDDVCEIITASGEGIVIINDGE